MPGPLRRWKRREDKSASRGNEERLIPEARSAFSDGGHEERAHWRVQIEKVQDRRQELGSVFRLPATRLARLQN